MSNHKGEMHVSLHITLIYQHVGFGFWHQCRRRWRGEFTAVGPPNIPKQQQGEPHTPVLTPTIASPWRGFLRDLGPARIHFLDWVREAAVTPYPRWPWSTQRAGMKHRYPKGGWRGSKDRGFKLHTNCGSSGQTITSHYSKGCGGHITEKCARSDAGAAIPGQMHCWLWTTHLRTGRWTDLSNYSDACPWQAKLRSAW